MKILSDCINLINEINYILDLDFEKLVSFQRLKSSIKVGQILIIEGSINECLVNEEGQLKFKTTIPPSCLFNRHWHNCKETIEVIKGTYQDKMSSKVYQQGDVMEYKKYERHQPYNPTEKETIIFVTFNQ